MRKNSERIRNGDEGKRLCRWGKDGGRLRYENNKKENNKELNRKDYGEDKISIWIWNNRRRKVEFNWNRKKEEKRKMGKNSGEGKGILSRWVVDNDI